MAGITGIGVRVNPQQAAVQADQASKAEQGGEADTALKVDLSGLKREIQAAPAQSEESSSEPAHIQKLRDMIRQLQEQLAEAQKQLADAQSRVMESTAKAALVNAAQAQVMTLSGQLLVATTQLLEALTKLQKTGGLVDTHA